MEDDLNDTLRNEGVDAVRARHDRAKRFTGAETSMNDTPQDKQRTEDAPPKRKGLPFHRHREGNTPSLKWTIKDLLPEIGVGLISGQWGTYISFIGIDLAGAIACGSNFLGFKVKRARAPLIFANEGAQNIDARVDGVSIYKYGNKPLPIYICKEPIRLLDPDGIDAVIATALDVSLDAANVLGVELTLVLFDTISGAAGYSKTGDENDAVIGQRLIANMRAVSERCRAAVVGLDHLGKQIETGTLGSVKKEAGCDTVLAALGERTNSGKITNTRLAVRKQRDAPSGMEFPYSVRVVELPADEEGEPQTTLVIEFGEQQKTSAKDEKEPSATFGTLRRIMMNLLATSGQDIKPYSDGPPIRALPADLVRGEYYREYPVDAPDEKKRQDACRTAFNRALRNKHVHTRMVEGKHYVWFVSE